MYPEMLAHGEKASVLPSLEVLAHHLQEAYTVTSVTGEDGTVTITFTHADKHGEVTRTEYPHIPLARAVELGNLATQCLMRHPQGEPTDAASETYTFVTTSETVALRRAVDGLDT